MRNILILLFLITAIVLFSQEETPEIHTFDIPDSTEIQILTLLEGSTIMGRVLSSNESEVQFSTNHGVLNIQISEIEKIELIQKEQVKGGEYWFPNPNSTRLFFAPTGRMLKRGEGYFADYLIFFPTLTLGVTDNFSLGGGLSMIPGLGLENQALIFTPKIGIKTSENADFAVGALALKPPGNIPSLGILYGVGTFGSADNSITFGMGYGYADNNLSENPVVILGGESRAGKTISFVSENWFIPDVSDPVISIGLRFFGKKLSTDFAAVFVPGDDVVTVPYIDFVYKFK